MKEKDIWRLIQNWIAIEKHKQDKTFLEHVASLNEQNQKLKPYNLELYYQEDETAKEAEFIIITPYFIQLYKGFIIASKGTIQIENYEMIKQISYDFKNPDDEIEKSRNLIEAFCLIAPFIENDSYILNGLTRDNLQYYQEKNENGLYERILETSHYIKIGTKKHHQNLNMEVLKSSVSTFENVEELELVYDGDSIVGVVKNQNTKTCFAIAVSKLIEQQVEKIYQLL